MAQWFHMDRVSCQLMGSRHGEIGIFAKAQKAVAPPCFSRPVVFFLAKKTIVFTNHLKNKRDHFGPVYCLPPKDDHIGITFALKVLLAVLFHQKMLLDDFF